MAASVPIPSLGVNPIYLSKAKEGKAPVYPSAWFEAHPGSKPTLQYRAGTPDTQFTIFQDMLTNDRWSDWIVTSYMVSIIREQHAIFKVTNTGQEWSSFNRVIAQAGEDVDPLCVLDLDEGDPWPAQAAGESGVEERLSALWGLLLVYRRYEARAHKDVDLQIRLLTFFEELGMMKKEIQRFACCVSQDCLTPGYCKVMAAIDMFFYHFKDAPFAKIRMATKTIRFRGCVAHTSLDQVSHELGIDPLVILQFVPKSQGDLAEDIIRLRKDGQHQDDLHGYFPYQLDLQLTTRSAYSMGANPTFYLWIHVIGAMAGFMRSVNAKTPKVVMDFTETLSSAVAVGLELAKGGDFTRESVNLKAKEILDRLKINQGLDAEQRDLVLLKVVRYRTPRPDTIGGMLCRTYVRDLC